MARANRHHIPGQVWHITHRCHKREFLLKFARDRKRWIQWLFEAKKRYGLDILNYTVISNHIHLLVVDGKREVIPKSLQLVAGKTAQEFNRRKERKGAFWEDRYHASAKRIAAVTENKRRRHYGHAASLALACAQVDGSPERTSWLAAIRDKYRRYPALQREFGER